MANVWCADETFLGQLIFLSDQNLVVDSPDKDKASQIRDELLGGSTPAAVLSSDSVDIPLLSVVKIMTDKNDDEIEIHYKSGKETKEETLRLASKEKRDEVYAALKGIFGSKFEEAEEVWSMPRAIYAPLMSGTIFGCLTWLFANAAAELRAVEEYEISGSRRGLKALFAWILEVLGPTGVWIIGGGICLLCAMSLFNRIKEPPVYMILQEGAYKKPSMVKLFFKYSILTVIWFFVIRVFMI